VENFRPERAPAFPIALSRRPFGWARRLGSHAPSLARLGALVAAALATAWWIQLAVQANLDMADGRYMLFMDELITFDGVERIQTAQTVSEAAAALSGPDQRYGRTVWYLAYLSGTLGEAIGGERGQIVATRLAFAATLVLALALWCWALIRSYSLRLLAFIAALTTPFASYYAAMPKPEPLMLLFLSLYAVAAQRFGRGLGASFLFLGLAYGMKISAFPAIAVLVVFAMTRGAAENGERLMRRAASSVGWFILGFVAAVPIVLADVPNGLTNHFAATWGSRTHGADSSTIGPLAWLTHIHDGAFFGWGAFGWLALGLLSALAATPAVLTVAYQASTHAAWRVRVRNWVLSDGAFLTVVAAAGAGLLASIVLSAQRLWGFYLFPGTILLIVGALAAADWAADRPVGPDWIRLGSKLAALVGLANVLPAGAIHTQADFLGLANRSNDAARRELEHRYENRPALADLLDRPSFDGLQRRYAYITGLSMHVARTRGDRIDVSFAARNWFPESTASVRYFPFYGPYREWPSGRALVFADAGQSGDALSVKRGTPYDAIAEEARRLAVQHTDWGGPCERNPCFIQLNSEIAGLEVFARADLADIARKWRETTNPAPSP